MYFFKREQSETYPTLMSLEAYRDRVNNYANLYVQDTNDGLDVEWKLGRGIFVTATCKFVADTGSNENIIEVTARVKHATLYQSMIIGWIIIGGLWIIIEPSESSLQAFLFGGLVSVGLWSVAASNRNTLLKNLAPD